MGKIKESSFVNFDAEKFKKYIEDNNIKASTISREMGHGSGYLSDILRGHGRFKANQYKIMTLILNVPYDYFIVPEIKPLNPKAEKSEESTNNSEIKAELIRLNYKTKKLVDRAEKQEELLTNIDLSLRNIGNLLVQINEKFFEKVRNND